MVDIVRILLGLDQPEEQTKRHKPKSKSGRSKQRSKLERAKSRRSKRESFVSEAEPEPETKEE